MKTDNRNQACPAAGGEGPEPGRSSHDTVASRPIGGHARTLLYGCVFVSGASALAYELVWTRWLELSIGDTAYAFATAVAAFMGGLALGSRFIGPRVDRSGRPVRFYAILELCIGVYCWFVPDLLAAIRTPLLAWHAPLGSHPVLHTLPQFALAFLVLALPTALMGATLPVASRALLRGQGEILVTTSLLYSTNTLGAAAGCLAFGFWTLPALGATRANLLAVGGNLLAGTVALLLARGRKRITHDREPPQTAAGAMPIPVRILTLGVAMSSAVAMLYQIAWARTLVVVVGNSTYAISIILVTFLLGIAAGSYVVGRYRVRAGPELFALLQVGVGVSAMLLIPCFQVLPRLFIYLFHGLEGSFAGIVATQFLVVFVVVIVPTTLIGMTLPCAAATLSQDPNRLGTDLGRLYGWSSAGAVVGAVLAGFFLIPHIGARSTIAAGVACNALAAGAVLWLQAPRWRLATAGGAAGLLLLLAVLPPWDPRILSLGVAVYPEYFPEGDEEAGFERVFGDIAEVLFFREGLGATVSVVEHQSGQRSLFINGKMDAGDNTDVATQTRLATIPLSLHPRPSNIAVVGLGSGMTAGVASRFGDARRVDVIELEPAVVTAAEFFNHINFGVLSNPKVRVVVDDARSFLMAASEQYDVIISEPSNPWMTGVADLFTVDFYQIVRRRLEPEHGLFCQWLPAYGTSPEEWRLILRSFMAVFPEASLWISAPYDYLVIGRLGNVPVGLDALQGRLEKSYPRAQLSAYVGADPLRDLLRGFVLNSAQLKRFAGEGPLNTDDRPVLQFQAPKSLYSGGSLDIEREIGGLRTDFFPSFVKDEGRGLATSRMPLIQELIEAERFAEVDRLLAVLPPISPTLRDVAPLSMAAGQALAESFDDAPSLPFFPIVGGFRPEADDPEGLELWKLHVKVHSRQSGVEERAGRNSTHGLVVHPIRGVASAGYMAELLVEPDAEYQVDVWLQSSVRGEAEGKIGVIEYDSREIQGQPPLSVAQRHTVRTVRDAVRQKGDADWTQYSFRFVVSPNTTMVQIGFYLDRGRESDRVVFDDVEVRRIH